MNVELEKSWIAQTSRGEKNVSQNWTQSQMTRIFGFIINKYTNISLFENESSICDQTNILPTCSFMFGHRNGLFVVSRGCGGVHRGFKKKTKAEQSSCFLMLWYAGRGTVRTIPWNTTPHLDCLFLGHIQAVHFISALTELKSSDWKLEYAYISSYAMFVIS